MKKSVENSNEIESTETLNAETNTSTKLEETNTDTIALIEQVHIDLQTTNALILAETCFLCVFIGFYLARLVWNKFLG